uniref:REP element-mobilizing transposase RayT n=1 Tax=Candidatus Kentrum sp. FM TaxID=2126340 RepID=A0A450WU55_9GAMM|nr:MAG: REP element-mobilizing transposase RayT [Candidatus Kentron sp. FM]
MAGPAGSGAGRPAAGGGRGGGGPPPLPERSAHFIEDFPGKKPIIGDNGTMKDDCAIRKHPAHGVLFADDRPTVIFDTVCTKDRRPWLASDEVHVLLREVWWNAAAWLMGPYVIMPDHIHFFAVAAETGIEYDNWVTYWKSQFSKGHKNREHRWLTDHWATRIRGPVSFEAKWEYIRRNPVRHGLADTPEEWPFQGKIHEWRWD